MYQLISVDVDIRKWVVNLSP